MSTSEQSAKPTEGELISSGAKQGMMSNLCTLHTRAQRLKSLGTAMKHCVQCCMVNKHANPPRITQRDHLWSDAD